MFACLFVIWAYCTGDYLVFNFSYLELSPKYQCLSAKSEEYQKCTANEYCMLPPEQRMIDWTDAESLHNWVERLDLDCDPHANVGMVGSAYFIGYSLSCMIAPRIADLYGRRLPFVVSTCFQLFVFIGIYFSRSFLVTTALILVFGFCGAGRSAVGYLYLLELVPKDWKTLVGTCFHCANSSTLIFSAVYFWFLSRDSQYLLLFGVFANAICCIGILFIPESPLYLLSAKDYDKARESLNRIGRINGYSVVVKEMFEEEFEEIEEKALEKMARYKKKRGIILEDGKQLDHNQLMLDIARPNPPVDEAHLTGSFKELFLIRKLYLNLLIMSVIMIASQFNYYLINFNIKYLPGNLFMNQIITGISEISFFAFSYSMYQKLGLKRSFILGFMFAVAGSVPLIFIREGDAIPAMILLARVGIAYTINISYLAFAFLFPPILSQTVFGFAKTVGRSATILAPMVAEMKQPVPMVIFTVLAVGAAISACFLITQKTKR